MFVNQIDVKCDKWRFLFVKNADQKAFFQGCLYTALIDLMEIMPYDKINIGVLCDKAGVSQL